MSDLVHVTCINIDISCVTTYADASQLYILQLQLVYITTTSCIGYITTTTCIYYTLPIQVSCILHSRYNNPMQLTCIGIYDMCVRNMCNIV